MHLNDFRWTLHANGAVWVQKHAAFCTHAVCRVWITAAKYTVSLQFVHGHEKRKQAAHWQTFPHGLIEYTSSQFCSASLFSLPAGYIQPSPDVIFRNPSCKQKGRQEFCTTAMLNRCSSAPVNHLDSFLKVYKEQGRRQQPDSLWTQRIPTD